MYQLPILQFSAPASAISKVRAAVQCSSDKNVGVSDNSTAFSEHESSLSFRRLLGTLGSRCSEVFLLEFYLKALELRKTGKCFHYAAGLCFV